MAAAGPAARRLRGVRPPARGPFCRLGARSASAPPARPWHRLRGREGRDPAPRPPPGPAPCVRSLGSISSACLWSPVTFPGLWVSVDSFQSTWARRISGMLSNRCGEGGANGSYGPQGLSSRRGVLSALNAPADTLDCPSGLELGCGSWPLRL